MLSTNTFTEEFYPSYPCNEFCLFEDVYTIEPSFAINNYYSDVLSDCWEDRGIDDSLCSVRAEFEEVAAKAELPPPSPSKEKKAQSRVNNPAIVNFIVDLLHNPKTNPKLIKWENFEEGKFKFVKPEEVSKLWGKRGLKNDREKEMDFGKFSRAIRYHYGQGNFEPVPQRKLVYKFGPNAKSWQEGRL